MYRIVLSDEGIRNTKGFYKNVDDILTTAKNIEEMEKRLRALLTICCKKNIKLNPKKIMIVHRVTFGGVGLNGEKKPGDKKRKACITPAKKCIEQCFAIETPKCRAEVQRIIGMANQLKRWTPGVAFRTCGLRKLTSKNVKFFWNQDIKKELEEHKEKIMMHVTLSPIDVTIEVHVHTDAALKEGMAYLLTQPRYSDPKDGKTIISCNSTTFRDSQKRYSPFECEEFCVVWCCKSEHYFPRGADEIKVFVDAKGLKGTYEGELGKIENSRLQAIAEKILTYNLNFIHVAGKDNEVADYK